MRLLQSHKLSNPRKDRPSKVGMTHAPQPDTIYFDASCGMCSTSAQRLKRIVSPYGFALAPLQDPGIGATLGLQPGEVPDEMKLRTRDGQTLGGADAIVYICRRIWWAWPIWAISRIPLAMRVMRTIYNKVARNRHRISNACRIGEKIF